MGEGTPRHPPATLGPGLCGPTGLWGTAHPDAEPFHPDIVWTCVFSSTLVSLGHEMSIESTTRAAFELAIKVFIYFPIYVYPHVCG